MKETPWYGIRIQSTKNKTQSDVDASLILLYPVICALNYSFNVPITTALALKDVAITETVVFLRILFHVATLLCSLIFFIFYYTV